MASTALRGWRVALALTAIAGIALLAGCGSSATGVRSAAASASHQTRRPGERHFDPPSGPGAADPNAAGIDDDDDAAVESGDADRGGGHHSPGDRRDGGPDGDPQAYGDALLTKSIVAEGPARPCGTPAPTWNDVMIRHPWGAQGEEAVESVTQGYTSLDSATAGTDVGLYVSTPAKEFRVQAYLMGYFGRGLQACQVWQSASVAGGVQHAPVIAAPVNDPTAPWHRSLIAPTTGWPAGDYLFRIDGGTPATRGFMPLTIRSRSFAHRVVLVMPDTTWQAYDNWGGYSLYYGPHHSAAHRARTVTFDRPYSAGEGSAQFLGDELPLITLAQKIRIPLAYATDVDLQRDPAAFETARAVISVGHDEYYSPQMRETLTAARDHGVNLAFLGANDIYRKIRFAASSLGPNREVINYKDDTDPVGIPSLVTTQWPEAPSNDPESSLTGDGYQCATKLYPALTVADPSNWLLAGTGVHAGTRLPGVAGQEFDGIQQAWPTPAPEGILFHGSATCYHHRADQDTTYYTTPSGAGVLDVGAYFWTCAIGGTCRVPVTPAAAKIVTRMTTTFLTSAAAGPLGVRHPATDTVGRFYRSVTRVR